MLNRFFESLYNKVIVNIVVKKSSTDVYIEMCTKSSVMHQVEKNFETTNLNMDMQEFINAYTKESPFFYIAILDYGLEQGAIPTCAKNQLSYYCDIHSTEHKCYENKWTYFTSKTDLYEIEKKYHKVGVDYIFSPFSLLTHFFQDKITTNIAMYILVQESAISLAIFDKANLLYAEHLDIEELIEHDADVSDVSIDDMSNLDLDNEAIDLDDIDASDEIDELEDFGDIEDLDSLEEIDEFAENKDIEEEFSESVEESQHEEEESETFNEDYQRFSLIQKSLGSYYSDEKYESQFIENVYIADGVGVSSDLKRYLEEEMFLNVYIRQTNLVMEVGELSKAELGI